MVLIEIQLVLKQGLHQIEFQFVVKAHFSEDTVKFDTLLIYNSSHVFG